MSLWKMPPKAKVYEALSAVADGRVRITGPTRAEVASSSLDKTYAVQWSENMRTISSNDNASHWQGYIGYPIIAVLLATGKIGCREDIAQALSGIPWKAVNEQFRRDYAGAVEYVLEGVKTRGGNPESIVAEVDRIFAHLETLGLERAVSKASPPKGK
jgi:hypothetical protein